MKKIILPLLVFAFIASPVLAGNVVYVAQIKGQITSYTYDQFDRYITIAEENNAEAIIIEFDTPGGRADAMMNIIQRIQQSKVPVIIYVYPPGATAASAGTYIALGSHLIAMAPGTSIGACRPILGYSQNGSIIEAPPKITNHFIAYIKSLAQESGRNETIAEEFITKDLSLTPEEALKYGVIEVIARDVNELLGKANGMKTKLPVNGRYVTLNFTNVDVKYLSPSLKDKLIMYITDPNVAYLLLTLGIWALIIGFLTPGWHVPETVGAIMVILAIIGFGYFGYNSAGILLIIIAMLFFVAEALTPTFGLFTVAGLITFIIGGILLFGGGEEYLIKREVFSQLRILIITVGVILAAFFAFGMAAVIRAHRRKASTGREEMIGLTGTVVEELNPEGMVKVRGELWRARSKFGEKIEKGERIKVVDIEGLTLIVVREGKGGER
ncbi:NfeD family protein [Pyrococcus abyssi]|uniref:NfeD nodulation protein homolog, probable membrane protein n=1 Tax=Pyrococcus abyssi (strain GE5 / Orsay) TaxID=272844 RepID=Q9V0Y0_PYRAB|nr:nodulation protein NfeD [Pyrococcus abyssi]CAB49572.1 nfeD nodulation protein homolog, probable membrane protein [Pyrococcus abyssi GE5]CCE70044.1 TPA: nodulation protein nfed [Pyrococcus abyssi GE5]